MASVMLFVALKFYHDTMAVHFPGEMGFFKTIVLQIVLQTEQRLHYLNEDAN